MARTHGRIVKFRAVRRELPARPGQGPSRRPRPYDGRRFPGLLLLRPQDRNGRVWRFAQAYGRKTGYLSRSGARLYRPDSDSHGYPFHSSSWTLSLFLDPLLVLQCAIERREKPVVLLGSSNRHAKTLFEQRICADIADQYTLLVKRVE